MTLTNFGSTPLPIGGLGFVGSTGSEPGEATADFSQTNNCGSTVGAGAACTITVVFNPSGLGARNATLNVSDAYADSPQQVALSGTGIASPNNAVPFIDLLSPTLRARFHVGATHCGRHRVCVRQRGRVEWKCVVDHAIRAIIC